MIDKSIQEAKREEKERVRRRMKVKVDPTKYEYIPAKQTLDYYDNEAHLRVVIYVRVSTDNVKQTTSFELQKKYYEDFVTRHPNWDLVAIYQDEGISGTSLRKRDGFNRMIADAKAGLFDIIITKSVSRFARNVIITIGMVRELAELRPPVGVFFESECIFSLNDDSQMALSFQATMAEEESHTRSRSMETSLRMRLDNGIPLTPKLLGFSHNADGELVVNPEEAPTAKLAFFMYLYGYSTKQIAETFEALGRRTYLGNVKWTSNAIIQILRNERYCGDVLTRKTFTPDYHTHLARKNRGERPQSRYFDHHDSIVSRDDFIAVQKLLDNAKYGNKSFLPELRVIESGMLKGFVCVNPRWAGFKVNDYIQAAQSVYCVENSEDDEHTSDNEVYQIEVNAGDFDFRGFEIERHELFDHQNRPAVTVVDKKMTYSTECVRKFEAQNYIELLINPLERKLAIRPTDKKNRNGICFSKSINGVYGPRTIPTAAFSGTLFSLMSWRTGCRYRIFGALYENAEEKAYIFNAADAEVYIKSYLVTEEIDSDTTIPESEQADIIRAVPEAWTRSFGVPFYLRERSIHELENQSEQDWKLYIEGQLFSTGRPLNMTSYEELRQYIRQELSAAPVKEG